MPDTVAAVKPSVVLVVTYNRAGKRITIRLGTGGVHAVKQILVADKDLDLAILETELDIAQIVPLQFTSVLPREGERLFVVSNAAESFFLRGPFCVRMCVRS